MNQQEIKALFKHRQFSPEEHRNHQEIAQLAELLANRISQTVPHPDFKAAAIMRLKDAVNLCGTGISVSGPTCAPCAVSQQADGDHGQMGFGILAMPMEQRPQPC